LKKLKELQAVLLKETRPKPYHHQTVKSQRQRKNLGKHQEKNVSLHTREFLFDDEYIHFLSRHFAGEGMTCSKFQKIKNVNEE
jgi:hypothetical protein